MPKFNSREEYEAWKAKKMQESAAKAGQQPTRQNRPSGQPARPAQPPPTAKPRTAPNQGETATARTTAKPVSQGVRPAGPQQARQNKGSAPPRPQQRKAAPGNAAPVAQSPHEQTTDNADRSATLDEIVAASPWLRATGRFQEEREPDTRSYIERVPEAFLYPFMGTGKYLLIGGVIMMLVLSILSISPILALIFSIFTFGYMGSYMMKIITSSSDGEAEPPDWPDFTEFGGDILLPAFQLLWTLFIAAIPAIALRIYLWPIEGIGEKLMLLGIDLVCGLYFPMALIAMSHSRSLLSVGPHIVLPSIFKVPVDYMIAVFVLQMVLILNDITGKVLQHIPLIGGLVMSFLSLYLVMAGMHLLGLVYYKNRAVLNWWGEEYE